MARVYSTIISGSSYSSSITLADYGTVTHDNSSTLTVCTNVSVNGYIIALKMIKDALVSAGVGAELRIYVNTNTAGAGNPYICPAIHYVLGENEYIVCVVRDWAVLLGFGVKYNSDSITMRPTAPSSLDSYYTGVSGKSIFAHFGEISNSYQKMLYNFGNSSNFTSNIQAVSDSKGFITVIGKNSNDDKMCLLFGKLGTSPTGTENQLCITEPVMSASSASSRTSGAIFFNVNGVPWAWGLNLISTGGISGGFTPNDSTTVTAFPVYAVRQMDSSASANPGVVCSILPDALLMSYKNPNFYFGNKFANSTYMCVWVDSSFQSFAIIPWNSNVASVFD